MKLRIGAAALALAFAGGTLPAYAWGTAGHTLINTIAAAQLAGRVPAFVTSPGAQFEIAYLGPEPDRLKGSGRAWDADYDPGHFLDLLDNGTVANAVSLTSLPPSREAYDTALRAQNTDQYRQGYLPYSILEGWEQLRSDFAFWQVDNYAATHASTPQLRAREAAIRSVDEAQVVYDLGTWGHYVGDAAQPLHVTVHFNGWGDYPNPENFSQSRELHSFFESTFVNRYVTRQLVEPYVSSASTLTPPQALLTQEQAMQDVATYLQATLATVVPLYRLEKAGAFSAGSADAVRFTSMRLAAGAMEERDLAVLAWQDSVHVRVGYPAVTVSDVLNGSAPWPPRPRD